MNYIKTQSGKYLNTSQMDYFDVAQLKNEWIVLARKVAPEFNDNHHDFLIAGKFETEQEAQNYLDNLFG